MKIFLKGKVSRIKKTSFEGKDSFKLQFLTEDEERGLSITEVKLLDTEKVENIKKDVFVEMGIRINTMNNKIYYSQDGEIKYQK